MSDIIKFKLTNGDNFGIYRQTLERYPNSFLTKLITHEINSSFHSRDAEDSFIIDEDPMIFSSILTFYRCGVLTIIPHHQQINYLQMMNLYMYLLVLNIQHQHLCKLNHIHHKFQHFMVVHLFLHIQILIVQKIQLK